jgi:phage-related minor tail protein
MTAEDKPREMDRKLLERAELALTQLHTQYGLTPEQSSALTAIRLRLEGKERASLEDLLAAGKDLGGKDPLADAMRRQGRKTSFEDALAEAEQQKKRKSLDDLL